MCKKGESVFDSDCNVQEGELLVQSACRSIDATDAHETESDGGYLGCLMARLRSGMDIWKKDCN